ncbi:MAG: hypothetical protein M3032_05785 [Verrucomicrobiota bacterium]|nr:hypothetical protein [Verrucomicrobiota bacterium]
MNRKSFILTGATVATIALCTPMAAFAAPKASPSPSPSASASAKASPPAKSSASPTEKAARAIPFRGTVASVDKSAQTFTIQGKENARVFKVTDKTTVTKSGAGATFAEIAENEKVTGSYWKQADGSLECKSVKVHPAGEQAAPTSKKSKKKGDAASAGASPAASPSASPKK